jgi:hypothetical protein
MNYDQINYLLAKIFHRLKFKTGELRLERQTIRAFHLSQPWVLEGHPYLWDESIEGDLIIDLARLLIALDLPVDKPIQLNISEEFKTEVTLTQASAPKTYIFRVIPLNPYEKLTRLGEQFNDEVSYSKSTSV